MRARWAIVPAVSSHKAPSSQLGEGMLGFAVSLGVPPPDHNVRPFTFMCSHVTWSYNLATSLTLSSSFQGPLPLRWKLSLPLLIPLVFKLHT